MTLSPLGHSIGHKHGEHLDKLYSINTFDTLKTFILFLGKKKKNNFKTGCRILAKSF